MATIQVALSHPGEDIEVIKREMYARNAAHAAATRSLSQCQDSAGALNLRRRSATRRAEKVTELRNKRGLAHGALRALRFCSTTTHKADCCLQNPCIIKREI